MVPKKVFFTKGVGKHKDELQSFELALRNAGIEKSNLVKVSSIIPPKCKIKIYTERGDLVDTIEHTDKSGSHLWDSVTSSRQIVVSGIYIAHFEVTEDYEDPDTAQTVRKGETTYRKFVVIR